MDISLGQGDIRDSGTVISLGSCTWKRVLAMDIVGLTMKTFRNLMNVRVEREGDGDAAPALVAPSVVKIAQVP